MIENNFNKTKLIISLLLKKIPYIYLKNIFELIICNKRYVGDDTILVDYLKIFYSSFLKSSNFNLNKKYIYTKFNKLEFTNFKNYILNNMDNICYNAHISNYSDNLEKDISLSKKDLYLNNSDFLLLFNCYTDLNNNYKIRKNILYKINRCNIYPKYKGKGDNKSLDNFRFLFDHNKFFKILDKLLSIEIIQKLKKNNKLPDKNIYCANIDKSYSHSIKELAYDIVKSNDDIILVDISKAFDNLEYDFIERKLYNYLSKRLSLKDAYEITSKYLYLLKNRRIFYKKNEINVLKGIATGLSSSGIIFTLLFDEIISEYINYLRILGIKLNEDYFLKIFMDDICIKVINHEKKQIIYDNLINILLYNRYKINKDKCKCSNNLSIANVNCLKDGDLYLGLPFSSSIKNYLEIIFNQFQKRHIDITFKDINRVLKIKKIYGDLTYLSEITKKINGFFQYKLYGLKKYGLEVKVDDLLNLIEKYLK